MLYKLEEGPGNNVFTGARTHPKTQISKSSTSGGLLTTIDLWVTHDVPICLGALWNFGSRPMVPHGPHGRLAGWLLHPVPMGRLATSPGAPWESEMKMIGPWKRSGKTVIYRNNVCILYMLPMHMIIYLHVYDTCIVDAQKWWIYCNYIYVWFCMYIKNQKVKHRWRVDRMFIAMLDATPRTEVL